MKSSDQLMRMLRLVPYLQRHPGVTVKEVAEYFGIDERHLLGDLEVLQFCGLPAGYVDDLFSIDLEATREDGMIFLSNAEVLNTPPRLSAAEATSLLVALEALRGVSGDDVVLERVIAKLSEANDHAQQQVRVEIATGEASHHRLLLDAIEAREAVQLDYTSLTRRSRPVVEPARIRGVDGFTYLDAWSREREAWRSYRLDRIRAVDATGERFVPREGLEEATDQWFRETTTSVTLTLTPAARWVTEYYPVSSVTDDGDQIHVTMPVGSREWLAGLILRLGPNVLSVSEPSLVEQAAAQARRALEHYNG